MGEIGLSDTPKMEANMNSTKKTPCQGKEIRPQVAAGGKKRKKGGKVQDANNSPTRGTANHSSRWGETRKKIKVELAKEGVNFRTTVQGGWANPWGKKASKERWLSNKETPGGEVEKGNRGF